MLFKSGRITQDQLKSATDEQAVSQRQLGRILVDSGAIERAEVEKFIRIQVEEAVYALFGWNQGTFTFTSDQLPPHQSLPVSLDARACSRGRAPGDEWSLIQKKIRRSTCLQGEPAEDQPRQRGRLHRRAEAHPAACRRHARRVGHRRAVGLERVRGREGAVRPAARRVRAAHRASRQCPAPRVPRAARVRGARGRVLRPAAPQGRGPAHRRLSVVRRPAAHHPRAPYHRGGGDGHQCRARGRARRRGAPVPRRRPRRPP